MIIKKDWGSTECRNMHRFVRKESDFRNDRLILVCLMLTLQILGFVHLQLHLPRWGKRHLLMPQKPHLYKLNHSRLILFLRGLKKTHMTYRCCLYIQTMFQTCVGQIGKIQLYLFFETHFLQYLKLLTMIYFSAGPWYFKIHQPWSEDYEVASSSRVVVLRCDAAI